jgi:hypothetical protein
MSILNAQESPEQVEDTHEASGTKGALLDGTWLVVYCGTLASPQLRHGRGLSQPQTKRH